MGIASRLAAERALSSMISAAAAAGPATARTVRASFNNASLFVKEHAHMLAITTGTLGLWARPLVPCTNGGMSSNWNSRTSARH